MDDNCQLGEVSNGVVAPWTLQWMIHFYLYCPDRGHHWWYVRAHVQGTDLVNGRMFQVDNNQMTPATNDTVHAIFLANQII